MSALESAETVVLNSADGSLVAAAAMAAAAAAAEAGALATSAMRAKAGRASYIGAHSRSTLGLLPPSDILCTQLQHCCRCSEGDES